MWKKWLVHIRNQHVGMFNDEKEAAIAYNNHAKEHFGVFAKLNHIDWESFKFVYLYFFKY